MLLGEIAAQLETVAGAPSQSSAPALMTQIEYEYSSLLQALTSTGYLPAETSGS
jgi:hypothetical protein